MASSSEVAQVVVDECYSVDDVVKRESVTVSKGEPAIGVESDSSSSTSTSTPEDASNLNQSQLHW